MKTAPRETSPLVGPIAVRGYLVKHGATRSAKPSQQTLRWGTSVLLLDTETTVDASQALLFGSYRYCRWDGPVLVCVEEGLIYVDELPIDNPGAFARLERYAATIPADVAQGYPTSLRCYARREFLRKVFFPAACEAKALVVGLNLPFEVSRLACEWGAGRARYYNGFSFPLVDYIDPESGAWTPSTYYANVAVKHIDSKRSFIGFTGGQELRKGKGRPDRFLDLRTLAFALTNVGHSLASACQAFGVTHGKSTAESHGVITDEYIAYNRRDVLASQELLEKLRGEFDHHPIPLDPCKAYSPASIAKAYLRAMGVSRPTTQFPALSPRILGIAFGGYFGGRTEVRIRNTVVPVVYVDFLSMYPTVNALMGLWWLLTAETLDVVDCTAEFQALLDGATAEDCFTPAFWPQLNVFAQVRPHGDVLPVRARYASESQGWNIGVNPLHAAEPLWYPGPDLVSSVVLTKRVPKIISAFKLVPRGRQSTLTPAVLGGQIPINPTTEDFFRVVIEERKRLKQRADLSAGERARLDKFLKVLANAGSYGVYAEMNPEELRQDETAAVTVHGLHGAFDCDTHAPEEPGPYCCPPSAALITSGARLMLALLERSITDQGGSFALCDTDSFAIVASRDGGLVPCPGGPLQLDGQAAIRALTWDDVTAITARFAALSPYDRSAVPGSILKIEDENYNSDRTQRELFTYAISAKRYALFTRDGDRITIVKYSEHGLGHLLNPIDIDSDDRDWIRELWARLIHQSLGLTVADPAWLDRPAISRVSLSSPAMLSGFPAEGAYRDRVKPFNFALSAHVADAAHPESVDPAKFHLLAPYETDPRKWLGMDWVDMYSGRPFAIATGLDTPYWKVQVKSYRDVADSYATHPEPKSAAPDGSACDRTTVGLLTRRVVHGESVIYVGKESNRVEDVEKGLVHSWDEVLGCYRDDESEWRDVLLPKLRAMPRADASALLGITERAVSALRNEVSKPSTLTRAKLRQKVSRR